MAQAAPRDNALHSLLLAHRCSQAYQDLLQRFGVAVRSYEQDAYAAYAYAPTRPHCDKFEPPSNELPVDVDGISPFPGGIVHGVFGFDFAKMMSELAASATGPASTGSVAPMGLLTTALGLGAGLVQTVIAGVLTVVPPLIPPPIWNNMPLPCLPMLTGHNCFGAVLYPITVADFTIADVTDSMLDGMIAGFPNTFATKVGKTRDSVYGQCFASYMTMQCSSIFPRCTVPQTFEDTIPVGGRVPMCFFCASFH